MCFNLSVCSVICCLLFVLPKLKVDGRLSMTRNNKFIKLESTENNKQVPVNIFQFLQLFKVSGDVIVLGAAAWTAWFKGEFQLCCTWDLYLRSWSSWWPQVSVASWLDCNPLGRLRPSLTHHLKCLLILLTGWHCYSKCVATLQKVPETQSLTTQSCCVMLRNPPESI